MLRDLGRCGETKGGASMAVAKTGEGTGAGMVVKTLVSAGMRAGLLSLSYIPDEIIELTGSAAVHDKNGVVRIRRRGCMCQ